MVSVRHLPLIACALVAFGCGPAAEPPPLPFIPSQSPPPPVEEGRVCSEDAPVAPTFSLETFVARGRVIGSLEAWTGSSALGFRNDHTNAVQYATVSDDGTFEIELPVGRYSIHAQALYFKYSRGLGEGRALASGVSAEDFDEPFVLDLNLAEQRIGLLFGDAPFPDGGRGSLRFESLSVGDIVTERIPTQGAADVVAWLPADDTYRVVWTRPFEGNPADFGHDFDGPLPFGEKELGVIRGDSGNPELSFSLSRQTARLNGELLLEGEPFPANAFEGPRGQLHLGSLGSIDLDRESSLHFSMPIVPGDYPANVLLFPFSDGERETQGTYVSLCGGFSSTCDFSADRDWSPSVAPFDVSPSSTFEARIFRETTYRCAVELPVGGGFLHFRNLDNNQRMSAGIDVDGSVSIDLPHGPYEVRYRAVGKRALTPIGDHVLSERFDFVGQAAQEWTVLASAASVEIRVNGENMPDDGLLDVDEDARGVLYAQVLDDDGAPTSDFLRVAELGQTGQVFESFEIVDGNYAFWISTSVPSGKFWRFLEQNVLPQGTHRIGTHLFEGADMDFVAFDLHTVDISLQIEGLEADENGELGNVLLSTMSGTELSAPASEDMTVRVYDGAYVVMHLPRGDTLSAPGASPFYYDAAYLGEVCVAAPSDSGR